MSDRSPAVDRQLFLGHRQPPGNAAWQLSIVNTLMLPLTSALALADAQLLAGGVSRCLTMLHAGTRHMYVHLHAWHRATRWEMMRRRTAARTPAECVHKRVDTQVARLYAYLTIGSY